MGVKNVVLAAMALCLLGIVSPAMSSNKAGPPSAAAKGAKADSKQGRWNYWKSEKDRMRGTVDEYAELASTTILNFGFPYGGGSIAELSISRTVGKKSSDMVWLSVSKGQFNCQPSCWLSVKFDDGAVRRLGALGRSNGTLNEVIVIDKKQFIEQVKRSKRMIIEAPFYREGMAQMEFNTAGLKW